MARTGKRVSLGVVLAVACLLLSAGMLYASGGEGGHGGSGGLFPPEKVKDLLWRTMNFAVLVVILVKFLSKPLANALSGRRMEIMTTFEDLNERRAEVEKTYKEYEAKLSRIDQEVESIIQTARAQGEAEKERIIAEAERAAGDIKRQAEMAVQHELAEARRQLLAEIADAAAKAAEELVRKNLQAEDQVRLVKE